MLHYSCAPKEGVNDKEMIQMAAKKITFYATFEGTTTTRTSARPYTHASVYRTSKGIGFSFHASEALAAKGQSDWGSKPVAVVAVTTEAPVAKVEVPAAHVEIRDALLVAANKAKTIASQTALAKAAGHVQRGELAEARKTLVPLRTRSALAGIAAIKAL